MQPYESGYLLQLVILSEAKDLLFRAPTRKQVLRFAQDDNSFMKTIRL
jgi:hypothetical protein